MPSDISELEGHEITLGLRQQNFQQGPTDVYSVTWTGGGGFGDPLLRDPEKVLHDVVEQRAVSMDAAREIYGVVISAKGTLDANETEKLRHVMREERRSHPIADERLAKTARKIKGETILEATENLWVRADGKSARWTCRCCSRDLGPVSQNYKLGCAQKNSPIQSSNPNVGDWKRYIDDEPVFRQFFCPDCGALMENEISRVTDPLLEDMVFRLK
jgi:N-methylhydantoinase B